MTEIEVTERWYWVAQYNDGTQLAQFDEQGFHKFAEIQQDKLNHFAMHSAEGKAPFIIQWEPDRKLIHFYLNYKLEIGTSRAREYRIYCFGWESPDNKTIFCIMPDDGIVVTNDVDKVKVQ